MLFLKNDQLQVTVLDPLADRNRFGSRYCTGGYIWQIEDLSLGNLLSGPQYPSPDPTRFDGQGAPEVFETALGHDTCKLNDELLVIGVGKVQRTSDIHPFHVRDNPTVSQFCDWEISLNNTAVTMMTNQFFREFSLKLVRKVTLSNRTVTSKSTLINTGTIPIPLRWFAHPFFPHTQKLDCCSFSIPVEVPENPGFYLDERSFLCMREGYQWHKGCYRPLQMKWGEKVSINQFHDLVNCVKVTMDFPLAWMPVWANGATFSFEPYLDKVVEPSKQEQWQIMYEFKS